MAAPNSKRAIIGLILVVLGTLFLLDNLGFDIDIPYYLFSWPAVFVVLGVANSLKVSLVQWFILVAFTAYNADTAIVSVALQPCLYAVTV